MLIDKLLLEGFMGKVACKTPIREASRLIQMFTSHFAPPDPRAQSHYYLYSRAPTFLSDLIPNGSEGSSPPNHYITSAFNTSRHPLSTYQLGRTGKPVTHDYHTLQKSREETKTKEQNAHTTKRNPKMST